MNIELHGGTIVGDIEIEASPETVCDALTTPEDLAAWWGAEGIYRTYGWEIDLRPGGAWSSRAASATSDMAVSGVFVEVDRPHRLVYTWNPEWDNTPTTTVSYTLRKTTNGTHVHLEHSGFENHIPSGQHHAEGWKHVIGWLIGYLKGKAVAK